MASKPKFHDPTQQAEGKASRWVNEPLSERHPSLTVHTKRPFNAEPSNEALQQMYQPKGQHYRRIHAPVPLVDENEYRLRIEIEGKPSNSSAWSIRDLNRAFGGQTKEISCTMMCTGNRRGEFNQYGMTAGLPWANGSISTAQWEGFPLRDVLIQCGFQPDDMVNEGYEFVTFWGLEDYHISIPMHKAMDVNGDVLLARKMNGETLLRDHGYPLRVIVPGFVGARSVKWLDRIVLMKKEVEGGHQTGIAYKQFPTKYKSVADIPKSMVSELPPIDIIPVTSAITAPEKNAMVRVGDSIKGYAYSGGGRAIVRVDVSLDGGDTWDQAELIRAPDQGIRSYKAWAWSQWRYPLTADVLKNVGRRELEIVCKATDDQYNTQPQRVDSVWNVRGVLNTAWPRVGARL